MKSLKLSIILIITLVMIAIVYSVITFRPNAVVNTALERFSEAESATYLAKIGLENAEATQALIGETGSIEITAGGVYSLKNDRPSLTSQVSLETKSDSVSINLAADFKLIDDSIYLNITKAPQAIPTLASLKGSWIKLPRGGQVAADQDPDSEPTSQLTNIQHVSGKNYRAEAGTDQIVGFMDALAEILGTELSSEQLAGLRQSAASQGTIPVELTINRLKRQLEAIKVDFIAPAGNAVSFELSVSDLNDPVVILPPDQVVDPQSDILAE